MVDIIFLPRPRILNNIFKINLLKFLSMYEISIFYFNILFFNYDSLKLKK